MSHPTAPSGAAPPIQAFGPDGRAIDLPPLAREICARYRSEFADEQERYGAAGVEWCLHDNQYLLAWAIQDARDGTVVLSDQALWLAGILEARDFPVERLARNLQIASDVVRDDAALGELATAAGEMLAAAAARVAARQPAPGPRD